MTIRTPSPARPSRPIDIPPAKGQQRMATSPVLSSPPAGPSIFAAKRQLSAQEQRDLWQACEPLAEVKKRWPWPSPSQSWEQSGRRRVASARTSPVCPSPAASVLSALFGMDIDSRPVSPVAQPSSKGGTSPGSPYRAQQAQPLGSLSQPTQARGRTGLAGRHPTSPQAQPSADGEAAAAPSEEPRGRSRVRERPAPRPSVSPARRR